MEFWIELLIVTLVTIGTLVDDGVTHKLLRGAASQFIICPLSNVTEALFGGAPLAAGLQPPPTLLAALPLFLLLPPTMAS